ncbi:MAG: anti-sigma factor [Pseudomonadota bacterium]
MTGYGEKLSAYLDGELPDAEAREIEAALERDPALRAELEELMAADAMALGAFDAMLDAPVPVALAAAVRDAPEPLTPANTPTAPAGNTWWAAAAVVLALGLGGAGGYMTGVSQETQVAAAPGWLQDIADYHRVYAGQVRHLVEVGADEAPHIRTWLSNTVGAPVPTPDLTEHGLTFRGARLLVAAGKPVAQLMYTDAEDRVVALCLIATDSPRDGFASRTIGDFDMVSWGGTGANFVVVGDQGRDDLNAIATTASAET